MENQNCIITVKAELGGETYFCGGCGFKRVLIVSKSVRTEWVVWIRCVANSEVSFDLGHCLFGGQEIALQKRVQDVVDRWPVHQL